MFCGSRCISLTFDGETTTSSARTDFTLRPGTYWLTVNDTFTTARYLAGYAGRELADDRRPAGLHRYEVAQGFQPERLLVYGASADDVIERASGQMGALPERVWLSADVEGWRGPPACWAQWA